MHGRLWRLSGPAPDLTSSLQGIPHGLRIVLALLRFDLASKVAGSEAISPVGHLAPPQTPLSRCSVPCPEPRELQCLFFQRRTDFPLPFQAPPAETIVRPLGEEVTTARAETATKFSLFRLE